MPRARALLVTGGLVLAVALSGCVTGPRPSLGERLPLGGEAGTPVGNKDVDAVLTRLEAADTNSFTVSYDILRRLGNVATKATVVQSGSDSAVTIGDVSFYRGDSEQTCTVSTSVCEDGVQEARISDTGVSSEFYAMAPSKALRVTYARSGGTPAASTKTIADQPAQCVTIPVGTGAETYCAVETGAIALWDTADKLVTMTAYADDVDQTKLQPPNS